MLGNNKSLSQHGQQRTAPRVQPCIKVDKKDLEFHNKIMSKSTQGKGIFFFSYKL